MSVHVLRTPSQEIAALVETTLEGIKLEVPLSLLDGLVREVAELRIEVGRLQDRLASALAEQVVTSLGPKAAADWEFRHDGAIVGGSGNVDLSGDTVDGVDLAVDLVGDQVATSEPWEPGACCDDPFCPGCKTSTQTPTPDPEIGNLGQTISLLAQGVSAAEVAEKTGTHRSRVVGMCGAHKQIIAELKRLPSGAARACRIAEYCDEVKAKAAKKKGAGIVVRRDRRPIGGPR